MRTYTEDDLHGFLGICTSKDRLGTIADGIARAETDLRWARGFIEDKDIRERMKILADRMLLLEREAGSIYAELDRIRREVQA